MPQNFGRIVTCCVSLLYGTVTRSQDSTACRSPIQSFGRGFLVETRSRVAEAETGSGKTVAYLMPPRPETSVATALCTGKPSRQTRPFIDSLKPTACFVPNIGS